MKIKTKGNTIVFSTDWRTVAIGKAKKLAKAISECSFDKVEVPIAITYRYKEMISEEWKRTYLRRKDAEVFFDYSKGKPYVELFIPAHHFEVCDPDADKNITVSERSIRTKLPISIIEEINVTGILDE